MKVNYFNAIHQMLIISIHGSMDARGFPEIELAGCIHHPCCLFMAHRRLEAILGKMY
jgi:hypothetical protein